MQNGKTDLTVAEPDLSQTIRLLGGILGHVISEQSGQEVYDQVEEIRSLAKSFRAGEQSAGKQLTKIMADLAEDLPRSSNIVKSFSTFFQLVNLAEEHQRVRILRTRENDAFLSGQNMDESIVDAIATLKNEGFDADSVQQILNQMQITPVFTAHPTESRRKAIRRILKNVSQILTRVESADTLDFERQRWLDELKSYVILFWQCDETRHRRPTVMDEVRNTGMYFFEETLFDVIPAIYNELEAALKKVYPGHQFEIPPFLRYGSWIGGDRDGNPLVTNEVTIEALREHKQTVLKRYEADLLQLYRLLSVSKTRANFKQELLGDLAQQLQGLDDEDVIYRFDREPYRQKLILMIRRMQSTLQGQQAPHENQREPAYSNAGEFLDDLYSIRESLLANNGSELTRGKLDALCRRVEVFGFHLATLDVRQHSGKHRAAITEIFSKFGIHSDYESLGETEKIELLTGLIASDRPLTSKLNFSEETNSLVATFRLIRNAQQEMGRESMQTYIISMTESVSNLLEILLLMKDSDLYGRLDLVPLFETVTDLQNSPQIMADLFGSPIYRDHMKLRDNRQQIMIGYSDSNKDGGYMKANWMLFKAQRKLARTCEDHDVQLTLFHGRGGSLGRGGGPANRAILAQPPESVKGRIRVTEQGEVVSSRYSNPAITRRHLQQLVHAVFCSTGKRPITRSFHGGQKSWMKSATSL